MLSKDIKTAIALAAGGLYVYIGIKKDEAAGWTYDALLVVGILLIGSILFKLFFKKRAPRGSRRPFARPAYSTPVLPRGSAAAPANTVSAAAAQPVDPPSAPNAGAVAPFSEDDALAEWTATLPPGQTSWAATMQPFQQKPGQPQQQRLTADDIRGFAFGS